MSQAADDAGTARLLTDALDAERFGHPGYLPWFYRQNPRGEVIDENEDDDAGNRIAHYAVIPTVYRTPSGTTPFIFSTNVATSPSVRRGGLFRAMAARVYDRARAGGAPGMVGVGNDESTVVVVERFGWRALGPLPVRVCVPRPARAHAVESRRVDAALLASPWFAAAATDLDWVPVSSWVQSWTPDYLRWRLSRPDGGYVLHLTRDALGVSVLAHAAPRVRAAVLLKVFPRPGATLPVSAAPLVTAACRAHRAPVAVYAGFNAHAAVRGIRPPRRLQPSPLNLVFKSLDEERAPSATFAVDTFELLDMDAYDMGAPAPITFTLDVEDYAPPGTPARALTIVPRVLELLAEQGAHGTFFIVGELAEREPAMVRAIAAAGHEIALHGYRHVPLPQLDPATFRAETARGRALLEDLAGAPVVGYRAPTFSLVPAARWAVDELTDLGFSYSSSVLPARSPLYGWPDRPRHPFRWPTGLVELPCPVAALGPQLANPYLGGVYFRVLPWTAIRIGLARSHADEVLWLYCHPYDFDPDEPFIPRGDVGRLGNRLLWLNRSRMAARVARVLTGRAGAPLRERAATIAD